MWEWVQRDGNTDKSDEKTFPFLSLQRIHRNYPGFVGNIPSERFRFWFSPPGDKMGNFVRSILFTCGNCNNIQENIEINVQVKRFYTLLWELLFIVSLPLISIAFIGMFTLKVYLKNPNLNVDPQVRLVGQLVDLLVAGWSANHNFI